MCACVFCMCEVVLSQLWREMIVLDHNVGAYGEDECVGLPCEY